LPTPSFRSVASFLIVSSSIGVNASTARKDVAKTKTTQIAHGNHQSALPLDSPESVSRNDRTRSLSELDLLSAISLMSHLFTIDRLAFLGLARRGGRLGPPQIRRQHVEA